MQTVHAALKPKDSIRHRYESDGHWRQKGILNSLLSTSDIDMAVFPVKGEAG